MVLVCLSLAGLAKPRTFLWCNTWLMAVQLQKKNGMVIAKIIKIGLGSRHFKKYKVRSEREWTLVLVE